MKMKKPPIATFVALSLALGLPALAAPQILDGNVSEERVAQLTSQINWYRSLPDAERSAQQQGKMIFWVHMLGSLNGGT